MQLEFFETVLSAYFSPQAHEALKNLQGLLLDKACESVSEPSENPGHQRRSTRGSEDVMADDRQSNISPDDLLVCSFFTSQLNLNKDLNFHRAQFKNWWFKQQILVL